MSELRDKINTILEKHLPCSPFDYVEEHDKIIRKLESLILAETKELREALENKERIAQYLYQLLDDIDTAGDMAKSNDVAFRNMVEKLQRKKGVVVESCDGYTVVFVANAKRVL